MASHYQYPHQGFDFNDYHPPSRAEPFQWQLPSSSSFSHHNGPLSLHEYAELEDELRDNEQREFQGGPADSVHTQFQEEMENATPPSIMGVDEYDPPPMQTAGYMQSDSPFNLDGSIINEKSFLEWYPNGSATLSFPGEDGTLESIQNINIWMIEARCPLLAAAFEESRSGPQLHLEALSANTAYPFLRYLYTGSYAVTTATGDYFEDVPTSVLLHCQLYRLADIYDLPDLKSQAYVNVLRQCEFGCSSPEKPIDLCAAIEYIYNHLSTHEKLMDAIVNYCVSCFLHHRLAEDNAFAQLAYNLRPFHQALCRNSMGRNYENETAAAIIQLPFKPYSPETYASADHPDCRLEDVVYRFHATDNFDEMSSKKRKCLEGMPPMGMQALALAARRHMSLKAAGKRRAIDTEAAEGDVKAEVPEDDNVKSETPAEEAVKAEPVSEDEGFTLVPRRASSSVGTASEDESEAVAGPNAVEDATDSEEDAILVATVRPSSTLPIRTRTSITATQEQAGASDSDSDWTVV